MVLTQHMKRAKKKKITEIFQLNYLFHISSISKMEKAAYAVLATGNWAETKKEGRASLLTWCLLIPIFVSRECLTAHIIKATWYVGGVGGVEGAAQC